MESHSYKRARVGGSPGPAAKVGRLGDSDKGGDVRGGAAAAMHPWHQPSSRIYRVSRATGGKDRHSKVYTAKGLRDRRVRLSVSTAIQFYDLQDRLGYDQPSKAIEWLIKSAAAAIAELPTLESSFPEFTKGEAGLAVVPVDDPVSKSGCSSTSETSKGSVLSLSRSESRIKARERARERAAKDKDKDIDDATQNTAIHPQSSFTELLTGTTSNATPVSTAQTSSSDQKPIRYLPSIATADYFSQTTPLGMMPFNIAAAAAEGDHHELQHFSFLHEHSVPIASVAPGGYSLNFSGLNRGTLQSNSPFQMTHQHLQRLSPSVDGSNLPFFLGATAPATSTTAANSPENQFPAGFDGRLQLCYSNEYGHSDFKGKGKN